MSMYQLEIREKIITRAASARVYPKVSTSRLSVMGSETSPSGTMGGNGIRRRRPFNGRFKKL